jgi:hypothetical protein
LGRRPQTDPCSPTQHLSVHHPGAIQIRSNPEQANKYKALNPMQSPGVTGNPVGPEVFLAFDASGFMTGETLFVDSDAAASWSGGNSRHSFTKREEIYDNR